jgi:hypothetical protein
MCFNMLVYLWLGLEPFRWGGPVDLLPEFLRKVGFHSDSHMTPGDLRDIASTLVPAAYRPNGDIVCVAEYMTVDSEWAGSRNQYWIGLLIVLSCFHAKARCNSSSR